MPDPRRMTPIDKQVEKAEAVLAEALLVRITEMARDAFPDAMRVHTYRSDYEHAEVLWKVVGLHRRVLWDREKSDTWPGYPHSPEGSWRMDRDIGAYARMAWNRLDALASGGHSIALLPRSLETANGPAVPPPVQPDTEAPAEESFTTEAVRELIGSAKELLDAIAADDRVLRGAVPEDEWKLEIWPRIATEGIETDGCDCGHAFMGTSWHLNWCAWKVAKK